MLRFRSQFERAVGVRLLGVEARGKIVRPLPARLARYVGPPYAAVNSFRHRARKDARLGHVDRPTVAILVDHDKFIDFLGPVLRRFGEGEIVVLSTDPQRRLLHAMNTTYVPIDLAVPTAWPRRRHLGSVLSAAPHLGAEYLRFLHLIEDLAPDCLAVIEGNAPMDEVAVRAARALGIPSLCIQHGWAPVVTTGLRRLHYDAMAVWGDGFAEMLAPHNPGQRFVTTGTPALSAGSPHDGLRAQIAGRPCVGFFLQTTTPLITPAAASGLVEVAEQLALHEPEIAVIVREHPGHPASSAELRRLSHPNVLLAPAGRHRLGEVLDCCDVVVSIMSSTLLEAAALGKPVVIFNQTSLPHYAPDLQRYGAGIETADPTFAQDAIVTLLRDPAARARLEPGMRHVREHFFADVKATAPDRIVDVIRDLGQQKTTAP